MNNKELKKYIDKFRNIPRTEAYNGVGIEETHIKSTNKTKRFALNFFAIVAVVSVCALIILSIIKPTNMPTDMIIASNNSVNSPTNEITSSNTTSLPTDEITSSNSSNLPTDQANSGNSSNVPMDPANSSNSAKKEFVMDDLSFSSVESIEQFNKNNNCNVEPIGDEKNNICENIVAMDRIIGVKITNSCKLSDNEYSLVAFCIINNEKLFLDNFIGPWEIIRYKEIQMRVYGKFLENGYHRYNIKFECNGITYYFEITSKNKTSVIEQLQIFY